MTVNNIGSNMTQIDGTSVLFSYFMPVAAFIVGEGLIRTDKKWSVTTSKHINKWLDGRNATEKPQSYLDSLIQA